MVNLHKLTNLAILWVPGHKILGQINMSGGSGLRSSIPASGLYIVGSKHSCNFVKAGAELLQATQLKGVRRVRSTLRMSLLDGL